MVTSVSVTFSAAPGGAAHEQIRLAEWEAARRGLDVDAELTAHSVTGRFPPLPFSPPPPPPGSVPPPPLPAAPALPRQRRDGIPLALARVSWPAAARPLRGWHYRAEVTKSPRCCPRRPAHPGSHGKKPGRPVTPEDARGVPVEYSARGPRCGRPGWKYKRITTGWKRRRQVASWPRDQTSVEGRSRPPPNVLAQQETFVVAFLIHDRGIA